MKLPLNCFIEEICPKDRPKIEHCYLEIESGKGFLLATDGRRLVRLPVELSAGDTAGYVTARAIKTARDNDADTVLCGEVLVVKDEYQTTFLRPTIEAEGRFPQWRQVEPSGEPVYRIGLNAELLAGVQRAMGARSIVIEVRGPELVLTIAPTDNAGQDRGQMAVDEGARFFLMPCRV